uniref:F-box only protein 17 isoform X1 n=1 Tax=Sus scrofa TaxID=9823 RepID=A0A480GQR5_PIG
MSLCSESLGPQSSPLSTSPKALVIENVPQGLLGSELGQTSTSITHKNPHHRTHCTDFIELVCGETAGDPRGARAGELSSQHALLPGWVSKRAPAWRKGRCQPAGGERPLRQRQEVGEVDTA